MLFTTLMVHVVSCFLAEEAVSWHERFVPFRAETLQIPCKLPMCQVLEIGPALSFMLTTHLFGQEITKQSGRSDKMLVF